MLGLALVVVLIILGCILPMTGIVRGAALVKAGHASLGDRVFIGEIGISLALVAMGTQVMGDLVEADVGRRMTLWGGLFGFFVFLSSLYSWQFFFSRRAKRLRGAFDPDTLPLADEEVEEYLGRLKKERARWKEEGGVRKPRAVKVGDMTGWVRNAEGEEGEDVWRVETDFEDDVTEDERHEKGEEEEKEEGEGD